MSHRRNLSSSLGELKPEDFLLNSSDFDGNDINSPEVAESRLRRNSGSHHHHQTTFSTKDSHQRILPVSPIYPAGIIQHNLLTTSSSFRSSSPVQNHHQTHEENTKQLEELFFNNLFQEGAFAETDAPINSHPNTSATLKETAETLADGSFANHHVVIDSLGTSEMDILPSFGDQEHDPFLSVSPSKYHIGHQSYHHHQKSRSLSQQSDRTFESGHFSSVPTSSASASDTLFSEQPNLTSLRHAKSESSDDSFRLGDFTMDDLSNLTAPSSPSHSSHLSRESDQHHSRMLTSDLKGNHQPNLLSGVPVSVSSSHSVGGSSALFPTGNPNSTIQSSSTSFVGSSFSLKGGFLINKNAQPSHVMSPPQSNVTSPQISDASEASEEGSDFDLNYSYSQESQDDSINGDEDSSSQHESDTASPHSKTRKMKGRKGVKRGPYSCGKCGLPKKGHKCHIQDFEEVEVVNGKCRSSPRSNRTGDFSHQQQSPPFGSPGPTSPAMSPMMSPTNNPNNPISPSNSLSYSPQQSVRQQLHHHPNSNLNPQSQPPPPPPSIYSQQQQQQHYGHSPSVMMNSSGDGGAIFISNFSTPIPSGKVTKIRVQPITRSQQQQLLQQQQMAFVHHSPPHIYQQQQQPPPQPYLLSPTSPPPPPSRSSHSSPATRSQTLSIVRLMPPNSASPSAQQQPQQQLHSSQQSPHQQHLHNQNLLGNNGRHLLASPTNEPSNPEGCRRSPRRHHSRQNSS